MKNFITIIALIWMLYYGMALVYLLLRPNLTYQRVDGGKPFEYCVGSYDYCVGK